MAKIRLKQVDGICKKQAQEAYGSFMRHCQLKNLAPYSYLYYEKNLKFFFGMLPEIKYVDEIDRAAIEKFIGQLMDRGNRVTAINARLRAVHVFLRYCFEQEYLEPFPLSQIKEDESFNTCPVFCFLKTLDRCCCPRYYYAETGKAGGGSFVGSGGDGRENPEGDRGTAISDPPQ